MLICYFIAAQPPHGHDDPLTLVFALNDFASYTFLGVLLPSSFDVQLSTKIGQLSAMSNMLERSYLSSQPLWSVCGLERSIDISLTFVTHGTGTVLVLFMD